MKQQNDKKRFILYPVKQSEGFTLLEVIVAIFMIAVGLTTILTVISQAIFYANLSASKLVASYLAQEGVEIIRNIRDTNWLEGSVWTDGLPDGDWAIDYNDQNLKPYNSGDYLKTDSNGFYNYESGTNTKFRRKITLDQGPDGQGTLCLKILALVEWSQASKNYQVAAEECLYNWR